MSNLLPGFVGVEVPLQMTTETKTTNCVGCMTEEAKTSEEIQMLYPTKHDVDTISVSGPSPVPLSGGVILKLLTILLNL